MIKKERGARVMKLKRMILAVLIVSSLVFTGCSQPKAVESYPTKSIDMTILFQAGGAADVIGRKLADLASKDLGQTIVANVRTGGGGAVGYQYLLGTKPDGYSILWNSSSICVTYHQGNMPPGKDYSAFRGVAKLTEEASAIAVKADSPWKTLAEFAAYAKENPGKVTVSNSGVGSFNHLTAAAIEDALGVKFKHMPFDSKSSVTAVLGGQVDAMVNMAFDTLPLVQSGDMRVLAVVGTKRLEQLPDVPTMLELGYDTDLMMWRGIVVPQGTPDDVVKKLEDAFLKAAKSDEFKEFAKKYSIVPSPQGAADFDQFMAKEDKQIADLMEKIGLKKQ